MFSMKLLISELPSDVAHWLRSEFSGSLACAS